MNELLKRALALGLGVTIASKEKIQQVVDELVVKGELGKNESKDLLAGLLEKGEQQRNEIKRMVQDQVRKVLDDLDIATKQDLRLLEQRLTNQTMAPPTSAVSDATASPPGGSTDSPIILPNSTNTPNP